MSQKYKYEAVLIAKENLKPSQDFDVIGITRRNEWGQLDIYYPVCGHRYIILPENHSIVSVGKTIQLSGGKIAIPVYLKDCSTDTIQLLSNGFRDLSHKPNERWMPLTG